MSAEPISLLGGKSVYCINEGQLRDAKRLAEEDPESSPKIQALLEELDESLSRNERASLAFMIIERLRNNPNK
ncbi:MAG: hypothetical protein MK193_12215 [Lentisphaeria bacterium]|nr:hypothetical protein [Lentisphaeria bacterium]